MPRRFLKMLHRVRPGMVNEYARSFGLWRKTENETYSKNDDCTNGAGHHDEDSTTEER